MTGVIDVHAHILPGIDDGSRDWDESRRLLEESYRQGIRYIIATPHYSRRGLPSDIYDLSEKLKEEARKIAPDFQIGLGQETYYHEGLIENLKNGRALTLDGSQYVLVEFEPTMAACTEHTLPTIKPLANASAKSFFPYFFILLPSSLQIVIVTKLLHLLRIIATSM